MLPAASTVRGQFRAYLIMIRSIDCSSHQGSDIRHLLDQFQPQLVIVKVYLPQELGGTGAWDYTIPQAEQALDAGCSIGGYLWAYEALDPRQSVRDANVVAMLAGIQFSAGNPLWLDIESYTDDSIPNLDWIAEAEAEAGLLNTPVGIYSSREMWRRCTGDGDNPAFSHLPLWAAQYTPPTPNLDDYASFGGWTTCLGRQWTSTPIDQNVFREGSLPMPELTPAIKEEYADLFDAWWAAGGWMNFGTYIAATGAADVPDYQFREFLRNRLDSVVNEVKVHLDR